MVLRSTLIALNPSLVSFMRVPLGFGDRWVIGFLLLLLGNYSGFGKLDKLLVLDPVRIVTSLIFWRSLHLHYFFGPGTSRSC